MLVVLLESELNSNVLSMTSTDSELQRGQTSLFFSKQGLQNVWKQDSSLALRTGSRHCWQCNSDGSLSLSTESETGGDDPLTDKGESAGDNDR